MTDLEDALEQHRPVLRYDKQEVYFADGGDLHRRPARSWPPPTARCWPPRARAAAKAAEAVVPDARRLRHRTQGLTPGPHRLLDGRLLQQARRLHNNNLYRNRMWPLAQGRDRRTWLQYRFFYFYNDYNLLGPLVPAGLHEVTGRWSSCGSAGSPDARPRGLRPAQTPPVAAVVEGQARGARGRRLLRRAARMPLSRPAPTGRRVVRPRRRRRLRARRRARWCATTTPTTVAAVAGLLGRHAAQPGRSIRPAPAAPAATRSGRPVGAARGRPRTARGWWDRRGQAAAGARIERLRRDGRRCGSSTQRARGRRCPAGAADRRPQLARRPAAAEAAAQRISAKSGVVEIPRGLRDDWRYDVTIRRRRPQGHSVREQARHAGRAVFDQPSRPTDDAVALSAVGGAATGSMGVVLASTTVGNLVIVGTGQRALNSRRPLPRNGRDSRAASRRTAAR